MGPLKFSKQNSFLLELKGRMCRMGHEITYTSVAHMEHTHTHLYKSCIPTVMILYKATVTDTHQMFQCFENCFRLERHQICSHTHRHTHAHTNLRKTQVMSRYAAECTLHR